MSIFRLNVRLDVGTPNAAIGDIKKRKDLILLIVEKLEIGHAESELDEKIPHKSLGQSD